MLGRVAEHRVAVEVPPLTGSGSAGCSEDCRMTTPEMTQTMAGCMRQYTLSQKLELASSQSF